MKGKKLKLTNKVFGGSDGNDYVITVAHNLPEIFGLSFDDAFENWLVRTKEYTAESLCKYVASKKTGYTCITKEEYDKMQKK